MARKRSIDRTRTSQTKKAKKSENEDDVKGEVLLEESNDQKDSNLVTNGDSMDQGNHDIGEDKTTKNEEEEDEEDLESKFEVRQRVLARDEDGILYYANIRRKLYGINHQKTVSCLGIFDITPEALMGTTKTAENNGSGEGNDEETNANESEWHYFVHYEGWKTNWDRWVSESDIWEVTPDNIERMQEISKRHKAFQLEFKDKTKKRKIQNAGLFVQQWKQRLDALNREWDEKERRAKEGDEAESKEKAKKGAATKRRKRTVKAKVTKSPEEILRDQSDLTIKSCLIERQASHIQAIPLPFGLKRILVEDWENLNNSNNSLSKAEDSENKRRNLDMVHVLPAKITIRQALSLYLKEKGVTWGEIHDEKPTVAKANTNETIQEANAAVTGISTTKVDEIKCNNVVDSAKGGAMASPSKPTFVPSDSIDPVPNDVDKENDAANKDNNTTGISIQLVKEWTDMADGIVLYFEQSLMARLLYPSEVSQLLVYEESVLDEENAQLPLKVDIFGCEHLLRLLSALPRILDQQFQESKKKKLERNQKKMNTSPTKTNGEEGSSDDADQDAFFEIGSMILAKLQDLTRFLQKNQLTLFGSMYRRKTEQEIGRDIKIQRRQEKRLKNAVATLSVETNQKVEGQNQEEVIA